MAQRLLLIATAITLLLPSGLTAQPFDLEAYREYLRDAAGLTGEGLQERHPAGLFTSTARSDWSTALHADSIEQYYRLTEYERSLMERHGFVVTERQQWESFGAAFREIYSRDLPVFISTDAVLHAVHMSYDRILTDLERSVLIRKLDTALTFAHGRLEALAHRYRADAGMAGPLVEADLYLTIARSLLDGVPHNPVLVSSTARRDAMLGMIAAEEAAELSIFGSAPRMIDFSQFRPRGHYTRDVWLENYFRAMMWMGRIELYLDAPASVMPPVPEEDVQRQTVIAALLCEAFAESRGLDYLNHVDRVIRGFVGDQDNVTAANIDQLMREQGLANAASLLDRQAWINFRTLLRSKPYARQRILSQMLWTNPFDDKPIEPASAFMPLGQRFILDSYVLANVVHDKVDAKRMLPSSLDVLFALGNDGAAQLLQPELDRFGYGQNLAAMRYVVDTYDSTYWSTTIYGGWLNAIRALAPPTDRAGLPRFMRTAAWWQEKMNTQLASWAQLRHDNLLYAKQSYSGMPGCSFPHSLVEPAPGFYDALAAMARRTAAIMNGLAPELRDAGLYFTRLAATSDTLKTISEREINGQELTAQELLFLKRMLYDSHQGCVMLPDGWYANLFYDVSGDDLKEKNVVVADVHTSPANENGSVVGWVMHVGTGLLDMAVVLHTRPNGQTVAYVGPVMSYHERVTSDFKRLTDEEWEAGELAAHQTARPSWVNLYLAGRDGGPRGDVVSLRTEITGAPGVPSAEADAGLSASVAPNPSTSSVTFQVDVTALRSGDRVTITISDATGAIVATPLDEPLRQGRYSIAWPPPTSARQLPSGVYLYRITCGPDVVTGKLVLDR